MGVMDLFRLDGRQQVTGQRGDGRCWRWRCRSRAMRPAGLTAMRTRPPAGEGAGRRFMESAATCGTWRGPITARDSSNGRWGRGYL